MPEIPSLADLKFRPEVSGSNVSESMPLDYPQFYTHLLYFLWLLALGQLVVLNSECICPGRELRLECSVVGGISTTWRGTAFNCPGHSNEITLPHAQFKTGGTTVTCNNGMIIGHNLSRALDFDGSNYKFTSQLFIHLPLLNDANNTLDDRTVECIRFNGTTGDVIGNLTIAYARVSNGIHILCSDTMS